MTPAQLATLKADIAADPALSVYPLNSDGASAIMAAYNLPAAVDHYVWKTSMPTSEVYDQITWANLTPTDAPDGTQLWMNRAQACQGKQFNIQTLLMGRETINPSKAKVRDGLQDALTLVPSGVAGATRAAGWVQLQLVLSRKASRIEKLFATGTGSQPTPALMAFEGPVDYPTIEQARAS